MSEQRDYKDYYEIMDKIREDAFDKTYKAKLKSSGEMRAISIVKKTNKLYFDNFDLSKIFQIMKIAEGENNENVNTVKFFEFFETEDEFAIVGELYDEDLEQLAYRKKTFNAEEIKEILTQLNNTFKIMDKNKIVHRDIKPRNIFIFYKNDEKSEFTVKLGIYLTSDFISNEYFDLLVGTAKFIAPEIKPKEKYNEKCDLWSLGVIIYLLCFNEFPFHSNYPMFKSPELKTLEKSGNEDLDDLISKLLVKDPKERIGWKEYFEHPFFVGK